MSGAPNLETPRLRLRGICAEDVDNLIAMYADEETSRYVSTDGPMVRSNCWTDILAGAGHWALLGYGNWMIEERASGRFVGTAGFAVYERDIGMDVSRVPEAGGALMRWAQGQGMAREVFEAALEWFDKAIGVRTICLIQPENAAAIRLATNAGYSPVQDVTFRGETSTLFERAAC